VVQQGRLKDKDKLSRDELLEAVRFGADKIFKSKDSSITDDDIDMILNIGKKKTQELNEKIQNAEKGDLLDFKLDGGISTQTFEGIDYSQQGKDLADAKAAQLQAELLGIMDIGKRERRAVANYNETKLYHQQVGVQSRDRSKREHRLPKFLRLPKMEEWQMYDREAITELSKEEVDNFKSLPDEVQKKFASLVDAKSDGVEDESLPELLNEDKRRKKEELLAGGFKSWKRPHYSAFVRASAKFGRSSYERIAAEVGKSQKAVEKYALAFWNEEVGRARFSESEYERSVKTIERGEKKIDEIKNLTQATKILVSLFDNPWRELRFCHVNTKDKMFTMEEDRHLLCWSYKYGYANWDAIKMAIRRSPDFRFDYFLKSLSVESIGRRCEQLMKAAEKEIEQIEKLLREQVATDENEDTPLMSRRNYKNLMASITEKEANERDAERRRLEENVDEIEQQILEMQEQLRGCERFDAESRRSTGSYVKSGFPDDLLPDLVNLIAQNPTRGILGIANEFQKLYPNECGKKTVVTQIEKVATKESRSSGSWQVKNEYERYLDAETIRMIRKEKDDWSRSQKPRDSVDDDSGAIGPDGSFVPFPDYDGTEPPTECKKAFTLFCKKKKRVVKAELSEEDRRDKVRGKKCTLGQTHPLYWYLRFICRKKYMLLSNKAGLSCLRNIKTSGERGRLGMRNDLLERKQSSTRNHRSARLHRPIWRYLTTMILNKHPNQQIPRRFRKRDGRKFLSQ